MINHIISDENEMRIFANNLASSAKAGDIYLLEGTLGAGKSSFARSFIQSLTSIDTEVPSPTFTIVLTYDSAKGAIWHFDLYRLEHPDEIFEAGWEDAIADGISLVEWPERLGPHIPAQAKYIKIEITGPTMRRITINVRSA